MDTSQCSHPHPNQPTLGSRRKQTVCVVNEAGGGTRSACVGVVVCGASRAHDCGGTRTIEEASERPMANGNEATVAPHLLVYRDACGCHGGGARLVGGGATRTRTRMRGVRRMQASARVSHESHALCDAHEAPRFDCQTICTSHTHRWCLATPRHTAPLPAPPACSTGTPLRCEGDHCGATVVLRLACQGCMQRG